MKWIAVTEEGPFPAPQDKIINSAGDLLDAYFDEVISETVLCYTSKKTYLLLCYNYNKHAWVFLNGGKLLYKRCHIEWWCKPIPPGAIKR